MRGLDRSTTQSPCSDGKLIHVSTALEVVLEWKQWFHKSQKRKKTSKHFREADQEV